MIEIGPAQTINPKSGLKFGSLGKISFKLALAPNHLPSVAPIWSTPAVPSDLDPPTGAPAFGPWLSRRNGLPIGRSGGFAPALPTGVISFSRACGPVASRVGHPAVDPGQRNPAARSQHQAALAEPAGLPSPTRPAHRCCGRARGAKTRWRDALPSARHFRPRFIHA